VRGARAQSQVDCRVSLRVGAWRGLGLGGQGNLKGWMWSLPSSGYSWLWLLIVTAVYILYRASSHGLSLLGGLYVGIAYINISICHLRVGSTLKMYNLYPLTVSLLLHLIYTPSVMHQYICCDLYTPLEGQFHSLTVSVCISMFTVTCIHLLKGRLT
jgi:hypothetical protein